MHRWPLVKIKSVIENFRGEQFLETNVFFQHNWHLFVEKLGRYVIVLIFANVINQQSNRLHLIIPQRLVESSSKVVSILASTFLNLIFVDNWVLDIKIL